MRILSKKVFEFIPASQRSNIDPGKAVRIVQNIYCARMTVQDLCTENCENCKARLIKAFNIKNALVPAALLTWQMKSALAQAQEDNQAERKFEDKRGVYGNLVPVSETPLADLLAKYL